MFTHLVSWFLSGQNPLIWPLHIPIIQSAVSQSVNLIQNLVKLLQTSPNCFKPLPNSSKPYPHLSKPCPNASKRVQTRPNASKRVQTHLNVPNASKLVQILMAFFFYVLGKGCISLLAVWVNNSWATKPTSKQPRQKKFTFMILSPQNLKLQMPCCKPQTTYITYVIVSIAQTLHLPPPLFRIISPYWPLLSIAFWTILLIFCQSLYMVFLLISL